MDPATANQVWHHLCRTGGAQFQALRQWRCRWLAMILMGQHQGIDAVLLDWGPADGRSGQGRQMDLLLAFEQAPWQCTWRFAPGQPAGRAQPIQQRALEKAYRRMTQACLGDPIPWRARFERGTGWTGWPRGNQEEMAAWLEALLLARTPEATAQRRTERL